MKGMRLAVYRDGLLIHQRELSSKSLRLGRLNTCEIALDGDDVARLHAVIDRSIDGRSYELTDLSAGSTRLNGAPVSRAKLRDGDSIRIGHYRIVVRALWDATEEELAAEPITGEVAVRQELAKLKAER